MTSSRPYLIRALHEWIVDNDMTPYLLVNAQAQGVQVPSQHVHDGKIVLNIAPRAVRTLELGNEWICFNARFGGVAMDVLIPISAVLAIYAMENGQGMVFNDDETTPPPDPNEDSKPGRPNLKVVK